MNRYRPHTMRDDSAEDKDHYYGKVPDYDLISSSGSPIDGYDASAPIRNRARAGTLPSSWDLQRPASSIDSLNRSPTSRFAERFGSEHHLNKVKAGASSPLVSTDESGRPQQDEHSQAQVQVQRAHDSAANRFRSSSTASLRGSNGSNETRIVGSLARTPSLASTNTSFVSASPTHSSTNLSRIRSGSLASESFSERYGGTFSPWMDDSADFKGPMTGYQKVNTADNAYPTSRNRGATIASPEGTLAHDLSLGQLRGQTTARNNSLAALSDGFDTDGFKTLQFLSLDDPQSGDAEYYDQSSHDTHRRTSKLGLDTPVAGRDRASTLPDGDGPSRFQPTPSTGSRLRSNTSLAPGSFLASQHDISFPSASYNAAVAGRRDLVQSVLQPGHPDNSLKANSQSGNPSRGDSASYVNLAAEAAAGRARATSMGMLDARRGPGHFPSVSEASNPPLSSPRDAVTQEDLFAYAYAHGLDPLAFAEAAANAGVTIVSKQSSTPTQGFRARAGTMGVPRASNAQTDGSLRHATIDDIQRQGLAPLSAPLSGNDIVRNLSQQPILDWNDTLPRSSDQAMLASRPILQTSGSSSLLVASEPSSSQQQASRTLPTQASQQGHMQQPTRSLWIGNLHPSTTGQELMQAFARYGAIESLRLLPDKECGFVNFVEVHDAVAARDDVMFRLGGRLSIVGTGVGGTVRIGFGKIDSQSDGAHSPNNQPSNHAMTSKSMQSSTSPSNTQHTVSGTNGPGIDKEEKTPTRALWIGSIPSSTTPAALLDIFSGFGPIESARVLTHKNCGFINFEHVDDAVRARKLLNGREVLGAEVGAVRVGFAKVPGRASDDGYPGDPASEGYGIAVGQLDHLQGAAAVSGEQQAASARQSSNPRNGQHNNLESYRSHLVTDLLRKKQSQQLDGSADPPTQGPTQTSHTPGADFVSPLALSHTHSALHSGLSASNSIVPSSEKGGVPLPAELRPQATVTDLQLLMEKLSSADDSRPLVDAHLAAVSQLRPPTTYYTSIPTVQDVSASKKFDTTKLRDIRKAIEQGQYVASDVDRLATSLLDSIVELSSDYIGNTLVQKFFERCSETVQTAMLERIAPHLATIGVHKNGTWAAQKIIDTAKLPHQRSLVAQHLRPYIPPLLLDQFGNYVVQCVLPYSGSSDEFHRHDLSSFVFDAMVDRCWEIAQGRFGARSMRACLESSHASPLQKKRVAISIILNSVPLATSPNGVLLLTWLLDASNLPSRFDLLAPRFTPHLTHLCTHKLASLTVLKIVNQRTEPQAAHALLDALFDSPNDMILEEILSEKVHGSQFVTKVLSSPHLEPERRKRYSAQASKIVEKHDYTSVPAYRRLVEDLGLEFVAQAQGGPNRQSRLNGLTPGFNPSAASAQPIQGTLTNAASPETGFDRAASQTPLHSPEIRYRSPDADIFNPYAGDGATPDGPVASDGYVRNRHHTQQQVVGSRSSAPTRPGLDPFYPQQQQQRPDRQHPLTQQHLHHY